MSAEQPSVESLVERGGEAGRAVAEFYEARLAALTAALERAERKYESCKRVATTYEARAQKAEAWAEEGDALNESLKERVGEYLARAEKAEAVVEAARASLEAERNPRDLQRELRAALTAYDEPPTEQA